MIAGGWSLSIATAGVANTAPTISDIGDQVATVDTPTAAIPFTVNDADTPIGNLTLSRNSSNPTLMPTNNIVFGGSGNNRTVTLTPAPGQTGSATITVTVSDGALSASDTFVLTVTTVNTPPVLTLPPDATIDEKVPYNANATATDADVPVNSLSFALISGPSGLSISSGGVITWTPTEADGPSTNVITVSVTDDGAPPRSATNSYALTVNEVNEPPALTLPADVVIDESTLYVTNATAIDVDAPTNTLIFELVSGPDGLTVSADGTIAWTPTEVQGPGTNLVTLQVTDNGSPAWSTTNSYTVIVAEVNEVPELAPISDHVLNPGQTLSFTNSANDTDFPLQALRFSLLSSPSGAMLDETNGFFTWRPTVAQSDTTNLFELKVVDSGSPGLSTTQSFTVTVSKISPPRVVEITVTNDQLTLIIVGDSGPDYSVQASTDLIAWEKIHTTNSPALPFSYTVSNTGSFSQRFFRVLLEP